MPDYIDMGHSEQMGPQLRHLVEQHLLHDLRHYGIAPAGLQFDWSESCVEGHGSHHLDGYVDNYSGITLFAGANGAVAEGWMEFIHVDGFFLAYWDSLFSCTLDVYEGPRSQALKTKPGIPDHIWEQIPVEFRFLYQEARL